LGAASTSGPFRTGLDGLPQYFAQLGDQRIHLLRFEGKGPDPTPLLLTHGWPGSILEHLKLLPALTDPEAHGGDAADAFTLIIPSLPGFGFSGPPPDQGLIARQTAELWHALMSDGFGYERYLAYGSDLGAGVTAWLARDHPQSVAAIHLATPSLVPLDPTRSEPEGHYARAVAEWTAEEGGYMHEQATKPTTLAAALSDSPAGLAAWIGEKALNWSSEWSDGAPAFDRELLLSTLTLYWTTNTIAGSLLPYWAHRHADGALPPDAQSPVPTTITIFGGERVAFPKPPRGLAERYYTVSGWAEHPVGGHSPAIAEPELLADALRRSFRGARTAGQPSS
jgi:pimeloyl-ACP methyl ester carboxylesterase